MSNSNIQPIRTTLLHIRSKDCIPLNGDKNSNFQITLNEAISVQDNEECHITVTSAELPYSFYNISSSVNNNILVYQKSDNSYETLQVTAQNYSISQIIDELNNTGSFSAVYTATYNRQTMKVSIYNKLGTAKTIKFGSSTLNKVLGWDEEQTDIEISSTSTITSTGVINMATIHSLLIHSNISTGNVISSRSGGNSTILQKVSVDRNSTFIIYLNNNDFRQITVTNQQSISQIELTITDQNRNEIDFNSINLELSLQFSIFPRYRSERRNIIQPPQPRENITQIEAIERPMGTTPMTPITEEDYHPIEGKTDSEQKEERLALDNLIDKIPV
jgi:hypothetical protein|tara:strand:- start:674 stop:1669 length:996 start_codon:yes stop_codon:yes gene_type:complete